MGELRKKLLKKRFLAFNNGVKSIQTVGYNGARTVIVILRICSACNNSIFSQREIDHVIQDPTEAN